MSDHLLNLSLVLLVNYILASSAQRQVYVVYLGNHNGQKTQHEIEDTHHSYLHSVKGSLEEAKSNIVYSYTKVIYGFCAFLTPQEADAISEMDGVISVFKDEPKELQTARSWDFVNLLEANGNVGQAFGLQELWHKAKSGTDMIVGELQPITDHLLNHATPFSYGSGHIQPSTAADPGLVYDASYEDYLLFLCSSIGQSLDPSFKCPGSGVPSPSKLNYPSLAIANVQGVTTVKRRVKNVGSGMAKYSVSIEQPAGYSVRVSPSTLSFTKTGQTLSFNIVVRPLSSAVKNQYAFGSYTWTNGVHRVRSPIALSTK